MKRAFNNGQLGLPFGTRRGLPFVVSQPAICRAARRACQPRLNGAQAKNLFRFRQYQEGVALLRQLRRRYSEQVRVWRRSGHSGGAAAFACTAEGRRAHALIDALAIHVAEQASLCG